MMKTSTLRSKIEHDPYLALDETIYYLKTRRETMNSPLLFSGGRNVLSDCGTAMVILAEGGLRISSIELPALARIIRKYVFSIEIDRGRAHDIAVLLKIISRYRGAL